MRLFPGLNKLFKIIISEERGSVLVLVALSMVALIGVTALVVDVGLAYVERVKVNNAVDAAALAGGLELMNNDSNYEVKQEALHYAALNDVSISDEEVHINNDRSEITVQTARMVDLYFAQVLGFEQLETGAKATAAVGYPKKITRIQNGNVLPFIFPKDIYDEAKEQANNNGNGLEDIEIRLMEGVEDDEEEDNDEDENDEEETEHFVQIDGETVKGNWGAIRLGDSGSDVQNFRDALEGYLNMAAEIEAMGTEDEELEWYEEGTKPGNLFNKLDENVQERLDNAEDSNEVDPYGLIPVVDEVKKDGQTEIRIVGFTVFEVTGTEESQTGYDIIGHLKNISLDKITGEITQDEDYNFGAEVCRLVE